MRDQQQQQFGAVSGLLATSGHPLQNMSAHHLLEHRMRTSVPASQMGVASDLSIKRTSSDIDKQKGFLLII